MFFVVAMAIGTAIGLLRGGRIENLGTASFRVWPLLVLGVAVQGVSAFIGGGGVVAILVSYAILLLFAGANFQHAGMGVVFIGVAMNFVVIGLNGGMPVRSEAIVRAGIAERAEFDSLDFGAKRHLETPDDRLTLLADIIPVPGAGEVLSFGDLAMAVGVADVLAHLLRRRRPVVISSTPARESASRGDG